MYCELDRLHASLAKCTMTSEVTINTARAKMDGHVRCCILAAALHCTCTCLARCGSGRVRPLRRPASGRPFSILAVPAVCCFCCSVETGRRPFIATLPLAAAQRHDQGWRPVARSVRVIFILMCRSMARARC
jgi:hypothetical protein